MTVTPELVDVLQKILSLEWQRPELAEWLAAQSLRFLESNNVVDRMVVADLDAALGEIQRGARGEIFLSDIAEELVQSLGVALAHRKIIVDVIGSPIDLSWGSSNEGGNSMAAPERELILSS